MFVVAASPNRNAVLNEISRTLENVIKRKNAASAFTTDDFINFLRSVLSIDLQLGYVEIHSLNGLDGMIERDLTEERQLKSAGNLAHYGDAHGIVRWYRCGRWVCQFEAGWEQFVYISAKCWFVQEAAGGDQGLVERGGQEGCPAVLFYMH